MYSPTKLATLFNDDSRLKWFKKLSTFRGENANVTIAFAPKFTSTAILNPRPRMRNGKISEIISQPMGPNDNCKTNSPRSNITEHLTQNSKPSQQHQKDRYSPWLKQIQRH